MSVNENQPVFRGEQRSDFRPANFYLLPLLFLQNNPTSGQTLYIGSVARAPLTNAARGKVDIPVSGTITEAVLYSYANSVAGSNQAWTFSIRLNNTTDTLVQSLSLSTAERRWKNTGLSIPVVGGVDYVEGKFVNPTWGTSPTAWYGSGYIKITL